MLQQKSEEDTSTMCWDAVSQPRGGEDPLRCGFDKGRSWKKSQMVAATFIGSGYVSLSFGGKNVAMRIGIQQQQAFRMMVPRRGNETVGFVAAKSCPGSSYSNSVDVFTVFDYRCC